MFLDFEFEPEQCFGMLSANHYIEVSILKSA